MSETRRHRCDQTLHTADTLITHTSHGDFAIISLTAILKRPPVLPRTYSTSESCHKYRREDLGYGNGTERGLISRLSVMDVHIERLRAMETILPSKAFVQKIEVRDDTDHFDVLFFAWTR